MLFRSPALMLVKSDFKRICGRLGREFEKLKKVQDQSSLAPNFALPAKNVVSLPGTDARQKRFQTHLRPPRPRIRKIKKSSGPKLARPQLCPTGKDCCLARRH